MRLFDTGEQGVQILSAVIFAQNKITRAQAQSNGTMLVFACTDYFSPVDIAVDGDAFAKAPVVGGGQASDKGTKQDDAFVCHIGCGVAQLTGSGG